MLGRRSRWTVLTVRIFEKGKSDLRVVWCSRSRSHAPEMPWQPLASRLCRMGKRCSSDDSCASRMPRVGRQCVITRPLTVSSNCGGQYVRITGGRALCVVGRPELLLHRPEHSDKGQRRKQSLRLQGRETIWYCGIICMLR